MQHLLSQQVQIETFIDLDPLNCTRIQFKFTQNSNSMRLSDVEPLFVPFTSLRVIVMHINWIKTVRKIQSRPPKDNFELETSAEVTNKTFREIPLREPTIDQPNRRKQFREINLLIWRKLCLGTCWTSSADPSRFQGKLENSFVSYRLRNCFLWTELKTQSAAKVVEIDLRWIHENQEADLTSSSLPCLCRWCDVWNHSTLSYSTSDVAWVEEGDDETFTSQIIVFWYFYRLLIRSNAMIP